MAASKKTSSWTQGPLDDTYNKRAIDSKLGLISTSAKSTIHKRPISATTIYTSACYKDFNLLRFILHFFGIEIFEDRKDFFFRIVKFVVFASLSCFYYLGVLAMTLYVTTTEGLTVPGMRYANTFAYNSLGVVQILWTYAALFRHQDTFHELFDHLSAISIELVAENSKVHRRVRRSLLALVVVIGLTIVGLVVYTWYKLVFAAAAANNDEPWLKLGVNHSIIVEASNSTSSIVICFTNVHLAIVYTVGYLITFPMYVAFVVVCLYLAYVISAHFKGLLGKYSLGTDEFLVSSRRVHDLIRRHHSLTKIIKLYDAVFRQPLAIWTLEEFVNLVFIVRLLNLHKNLEVYNAYDLVVIVSSISCFVLKLTFVSYMNYQVTSTLQGLTIIAEVTNDANYATEGRQSIVMDSQGFVQNQNSLVNSQIELYNRHVTLQPAAVTGMGLFSIYSGVLLTACGQSLTYILALYGIPESYE